MNEGTEFTHAEWQVKPGNETEFIEAWRALSDVFSSLERPPLWGSLLRSRTDPTVFYSFGPWSSADDVAAMRADPAAQSALQAVISLCESATPGSFELVAHVVVDGAG